MFERTASVIKDILDKHGRLSLATKNEAATRLHVIDRILFEGLGWDPNLCKPEEPVLGGAAVGFLDYALVDGTDEHVVVEAKKFGKTFEIPPEKENREYLIETLVSHCGQHLNEVIEQAQRYAVARGLPFAVATNGHQWIIFRSYTPRRNWRKNKAIVFRSFEDLSLNWSRFHGLLSRENVAHGYLDVALTTPDTGTPKFAKRYNTSRGHDPGRGNNDLAKAFNTLFRQVFDSITEDQEMLQHCYVSNDSSRSYQQQFATLLSGTEPHFIPAASAPALDDGQPTSDFVSAVNTPCVVVLVGNVGAGKTTFVHYFLEVFLPSQTAQPIYYFVKDLKDEAAAVGHSFDATRAEREFYESLLKDVERHFPDVNPYSYDIQRQIFSHELVRLKNGAQKRILENNHDAYLKAEAELLAQFQSDPKALSVALLKHISGKGRPLCVAFDNVDQGSDTYQQFVYTLAHRLAKDAECVILVTLRHSVYEAARERGFLDIRNDLVFRVAPPSLKEVVSKRIKHARRVLAAHPGKKSLDHTSAASLSQYLEVINELLLGDVDEVRRMLEALAAGNIRSAFSYLQRFAISGHTDVGDLITIYNDAKAKRRRPHFQMRDFFRPFVLGQNFRYHSRESPVVNLFEVSQSRHESHFVNLRILSFLLDRYQTGEGGKKGEVPLADLLNALAASGHSEAAVIHNCQHLWRHDLIERLSSHLKPITRDDVVRISAAGSYYLTDMIFLDDYIFFISQDTYIYESEAFRTIEDAHRNIENRRVNRLSAVVEMLRYLRRQEGIERTRIGAPGRDRLSWHRAFATEIGRIIVKGPEWDIADVVSEIATAKTAQDKRIPFLSDSAQLGFRGLADDATSADVAAAVAHLRPLTSDTEVLGSKQLARVIWALRVAQMAGLPPINASQISRLISDFGKVAVEGTNIARFFRSHGAKFSSYFSGNAGQTYLLSSDGAALCATELEPPTSAAKR